MAVSWWEWPPGCRWLVSPVPSYLGAERPEGSVGSLIRALTPSWGLHPHDLSPPKGTPPLTLPLGLGLLHRKFRGCEHSTRRAHSLGFFC